VNEKDVILGLLGGHIAIAGLVLVFAGFLWTKAESYEGTRSGDKYNWLAVAGLVPVLSALASAWMCIDAIKGNQWESEHVLLSLQIVLVLTAAYAIISALLAFLP